MGNLGGGEILVILLVALIVLGPTKLPPAVRQVGKFVGEIRRIGQGFQEELREAARPLQEATADLKAADKNLRETTQKPLKEMTDTLKAADPRKAIDPPPAAEAKDKTTEPGPDLSESAEPGPDLSESAEPGPDLSESAEPAADVSESEDPDPAPRADDTA